MPAPDLVVAATPGYLATLLSWGLVGVGLLAFGEKLIPVVPSYVLLIFLGMTCGPQVGDLALLILVTALGSTAGALCWYGCGRAFGAARSEGLVERYGRYVCLSPELYRRMTLAYRRRRWWVTLFGQLIPVVRLYLPIPAGVLKLAPGGFASATFLGSLLWNAAFASLGVGLRGVDNNPVHAGLLALGGLIVTEIVVLVMLRFRWNLTVGSTRRCSA